MDWDFLAINGLFAPAGTPAPVLARLNAEAAAILQDPAVRARITATGAILGPPHAASLGAAFRRDWERAVTARQR